VNTGHEQRLENPMCPEIQAGLMKVGGPHKFIQHGAEELPDGIIGRGSRGPVVLGRHDESIVAVKLLGLQRKGGDDKPSTHELSAGEMAGHAHVVRTLWRTHGACGRVFEARELAAGGEFFDLVLEEGPLPPAKAARYFRQVAAGVAHCHAAGLANGQLRMEHVLRDLTGSLKLIGFRHELPPPPSPDLPDGAPRAPRLHALRRHASLDPPEWRGCRPAALFGELAAADIFGLGILLATMLESQPPFQSSDVNGCPRFAAFIASGATTLQPHWGRIDSADDQNWARFVQAQVTGGSDATAPSVAADTIQSECGKKRPYADSNEAAQRDLLENLVLEMLHPNPEMRPTAAQVLNELGPSAAAGAPAIPGTDSERLQPTAREQVEPPRTVLDGIPDLPAISKLDYGFIARACPDPSALLEQAAEQPRTPPRQRWPHAARDDADILTAIEASLHRLGVPYGKQDRHTFVLELLSSPTRPLDLDEAGDGAELRLLLELTCEGPGTGGAPLSLGQTLVTATPASAGAAAVSPYYLFARDVCGSASRYSAFTTQFLAELSDNIGRGAYAELAVATTPSPFSIRLMNCMLAASATYSPPTAETRSCKRQRHDGFQATHRVASPSR
jgi:serine/threonine protein kinase